MVEPSYPRRLKPPSEPPRHETTVLADDEDLESVEVEEHANMNVEPGSVSAPPEVPASAPTKIVFGKTYRDGIPHEQIEELASKFDEVPVRMQRRNARGQLATLGASAITVKTVELSTIDEWAPKQYGGGQFRVEVKDPTFPTRIVFAFEFLVEGMPINSNPIPNVPAGVGPAMTYNPFAPQTQPLPAGVIPAGSVPGAPSAAWVAGLHPVERAHFLASQQGGAPATTFASDQVAMAQNAKLEARLAQMEERAEAQRKMSEEKIAALQAAEASAREAAKDALRQGEIKALTAKLEAMSSRPPEKSMVDLVAGLAPLVPLGIAWVQSNAQQQQAQLQHQQAGFQAMIGAATQRPADSTKELISTLTPILGPILGKLVEGNKEGPAQQAALYNAMAEANMNTISMAAQLVAEQAPPPTSAAGAVISQVLEGVKNIAAQYMLSQGGLPGQLPAGPRPAGVMRGGGNNAAPPPQVNVGGYSTVEEVAGEVVEEKKGGEAPAPKPPPAEVEALFGMLPDDFQSAEWRTILRALHTEPPADADMISGLLASHLEHLANFNLIPAMLSSIRDRPRETLEAVLEKLPVAMKHPDYARSVMQKTLAYLMEDGFVPRPAPAKAAGGDHEEDGDGEDNDEAAAEE
jgi:hypothetical protein